MKTVLTSDEKYMRRLGVPQDRWPDYIRAKAALNEMNKEADAIRARQPKLLADMRLLAMRLGVWPDDEAADDNEG